VQNRDVIEGIMRTGVWPDSAPALHAALAEELWKAGFQVGLEYPTKSLGDGRKGRIDIVARWVEEGKLVSAAIELDCRRPRKRSLKKLRLWDGPRIIGLRGVELLQTPEGIDAVIAMRVREPTAAEQKNKRTVNRKKGT